MKKVLSYGPPPEPTSGCAWPVIALLVGIFGFTNILYDAEYAVQIEGGAKWDTFAASEQQAEERVLVLPKDSKKWHISVIGDKEDLR